MHLGVLGQIQINNLKCFRVIELDLIYVAAIACTGSLQLVLVSFLLPLLILRLPGCQELVVFMQLDVCSKFKCELYLLIRWSVVLLDNAALCAEWAEGSAGKLRAAMPRGRNLCSRAVRGRRGRRRLLVRHAGWQTAAGHRRQKWSTQLYQYWLASFHTKILPRYSKSSRDQTCFWIPNLLKLLPKLGLQYFKQRSVYLFLKILPLMQNHIVFDETDVVNFLKLMPPSWIYNICSD